jgi:guanylate kinase
MSSKGNLIVLSAASGSGKTSLAARLLQEVPPLTFSVSHTTRTPREGERQGVDYFFVTEAEFEAMIRADAFLEHAHVYGNYYGTSRQFVTSELEAGHDVLLDIDVQGAMKVKQAVPEAILIFVFAPSLAALRERLMKRGLDNPEVIERRLRIARDEIRYYDRYDYLVINDDIEKCVSELESIVCAARCTVGKRRESAERIVERFLNEER